MIVDMGCKLHGGGISDGESGVCGDMVADTVVIVGVHGTYYHHHSSYSVDTPQQVIQELFICI